MIENGKPIGVVLTMEEYELLKSKFQISNFKSQKEEEIEKEEIKPEASAKAEINSEPLHSVNPIGVAMVEEMNFREASANIDEINFADAGDVTLEDLGLDELPY